MRISFTEHPASVGETYFGHLFSALTFCSTIAIALFVCLVHAFFTFFFEKTGSEMLMRLTDDMVHNRDKGSADVSDVRAK
jgi:hypothetical protein